MVKEYEILKVTESQMDVVDQKVAIFELQELNTEGKIMDSEAIIFVAALKNLMTQVMLDCANEKSSIELELELSDVSKRVEMVNGREQLVFYHQSVHLYLDDNITPTIFKS